MTERFYPVILAAISESPIRMKVIRNQDDYDHFYERFKKVGTIIIELKTLQSLYLEKMSKFNPDPQLLDAKVWAISAIASLGNS